MKTLSLTDARHNFVFKHGLCGGAIDSGVGSGGKKSLALGVFEFRCLWYI